jgi:hypothetical protein
MYKRAGSGEQGARESESDCGSPVGSEREGWESGGKEGGREGEDPWDV